eukprot:CAMPEP_0184007848 /NCGR_PEP_ID=MMETSP0954-20121128/1597_1 /TAXON_ID=627963 /ORGANISM="Aplanochytrium sp, Strain PBS07" /LENGTH=1062 /DNA_ID=CAMNT_0026286795 /DNA_START=144 /DNA_END=3329 /DNA_ORIENTATION=-
MSTSDQIEAQHFAESTLGKQFPGRFRETLQSGVWLCSIYNACWPEEPVPVKTGTTSREKIENLTTYLKACQQVGVKISFSLADLLNSASESTLKDNKEFPLEVEKREDEGLERVAGNILALKKAFESKSPVSKERRLDDKFKAFTRSGVSAVQKYLELKNTNPLFISRKTKAHTAAPAAPEGESGVVGTEKARTCQTSVSGCDIPEMESLKSISSLELASLKSSDSSSVQSEAFLPFPARFRLFTDFDTSYLNEKSDNKADEAFYLLDTHRILSIAARDVKDVSKEWENLYAVRFPRNQDEMRNYARRINRRRTSTIERFRGQNFYQGDAHCSSSVSSEFSNLSIHQPTPACEAGKPRNRNIFFPTPALARSHDDVMDSEWLSVQDVTNSRHSNLDNENSGLKQDLYEEKVETADDVENFSLQMGLSVSDSTVGNREEFSANSIDSAVEINSTTSSTRFSIISNPVDTGAKSDDDFQEETWKAGTCDHVPPSARINRAKAGEFTLRFDYLKSLEMANYEDLHSVDVRKDIWLHFVYSEQHILESRAMKRQHTQLGKQPLDLSKAFKLGLLRRLVRFGIPDSLRCEVWMLLSGSLRKIARNRNYYSDLLFSSLQTIPKSVVYEFEEAVIRWGSIQKRNREATASYISQTTSVIKRVLMAFYLRAKCTGCCVCFVPVIGTFLRYVGEEPAFWLLVHLVEKVLPADYYTTTLSACIDQFVLFEFLTQLAPAVAEHLKKLERKDSTGAPRKTLFSRNGLKILTLSWFMQIFTENLFLYHVDSEAGQVAENSNIDTNIGSFLAVDSTKEDLSPQFLPVRALDSIFFDGDRALFLHSLMVLTNPGIQEKIMQCSDIESVTRLFAKDESSTLPAVEEPMQRNNRLRIERVVDNTSIQMLRNRCRGRVIASFLQTANAVTSVNSEVTGKAGVGHKQCHPNFARKTKETLNQPMAEAVNFNYQEGLDDLWADDLAATTFFAKSATNDLYRADMRALNARRLLQLRKHRQLLHRIDRASVFVIRNELIQYLFCYSEKESHFSAVFETVDETMVQDPEVLARTKNHVFCPYDW